MANLGNGIMGLVPLLLLSAARNMRPVQLPGMTINSLPSLKKTNLRSLIADAVPYLPETTAGNMNRVAHIMDIAQELQDVQRPSPVTAAGYSTNISPIQRSMGLLSALKRNVPALDNPQLDRIEQAAGMVQTLKHLSSVGLPNIMNALNAISDTGNALGAVDDLMENFRDLPREEQANPEENLNALVPSLPKDKINRDSLTDTIGKALSGMDDTQKQKLLEMAHAFLGR